MFTHYGPTWFELSGKRWGIIGLGAIGRRVALLAAAFGCEVVYHSTSGRNTDQPYTQLSLEELCRTSQIISVHAPLNDATRGLIGENELGFMARDAVVINMGRGGIIDEAAWAHAVRTGAIGGAATDVFSTEPPAADNPLLSLGEDNRFLATPHSAWASVEARTRLIAEIAANIEAFPAGEQRNRVV
jgi:glycerate dehydrogenase